MERTKSNVENVHVFSEDVRMAQKLGPGVTDELRELRLRAKLSMEKLAKLMGYAGASSYQRYENPALYTEDYFDLDLVRKLARALVGKGDPPITDEEVFALAGIQIDSSGNIEGYYADAMQNIIHSALKPDVDLRRTPGQAPPPMARDLPVRGAAVGGDDGDFRFNGEIVDYARRPPALDGIKDAFAVYIQGDSMEPRYESGDLVIIHPGRPPVIGGDVIVELHGKDGDPGPCYIKRLIRRTGTKIQLEQFNPSKTLEFTLDQVRVMYRVLRPSEFMSA